ncbi:galactokinase [Heyndrickxia camelliae]|uniref:Galactokinase n=1 Tax=Heyndrickxia camelliae TaxID=1707093 RepID=A0A2N3LGM4_9BACI|nr:galactokinase [Heyndrickxia camelliae]PKR83782.1 galactokinase [Heyndrickxia camelliae]
MNDKELSALFKEKFQGEHEKQFFAPGRINLIGEHTDYNGGYVFPCAITFGTYCFVKKRNDLIVRMYSVNFPEKGTIEYSIDELDYQTKHDWGNYPKGMLRFIRERGYHIPTGFDVLFYGNIPNGAGLSSSASIEILTGVMVDGLFQLGIPRLELVKLGQNVENHFIGVNSGIMDQFAVGMGKIDSGILIDCQSHEYQYAPIHLEKHQIIIMNTNKRRELADSKYNERRKECEEALSDLQKMLNIKTLGEIKEDIFEDYKYLIRKEIVRKRAKHAVYENQRTLKAFHALNNGDLQEFGILMNASHASLRDDYEVTGEELDTLVEAAWSQPGVVGARMTGAGFGGCAIAIVEKDKVADFIKEVGKLYKQRIGYMADFYVASIGDGAKELTNEVLL